MNRRDFLSGVAVAGLSGCGVKSKSASSHPVTAPPLAVSAAPAVPPYDAVPHLMPIRAHIDRMVIFVRMHLVGVSGLFGSYSCKICSRRITNGASTVGAPVPGWPPPTLTR